MAKPVYAEVRRRDKYCRACFSDGEEVHHITFRSHGGQDTLDNLIFLCKKCHGRAHNTEKDYLAPWELQAAVFEHSVVEHLRRNWRHQHPINRTCTSCDFRSEQWECLPHEHPVDHTFTCPDWKERDKATLATCDGARVSPKSLSGAISGACQHCIVDK